MNQLNLICGECPLKSCDDRSLWCVFRFATDPNDAQLAFIAEGKSRITYALRKHLTRTKRRQYFREHYQANRDAKLAAANARYAKQKCLS